MPVGENIVGAIEEHVREALTAHVEEFDYAVGMTAIPTPQGPQPVVILMVSTNGVVLGSTLMATGIISPYGYDANNVGDVVRSLVEQCLQARTQQASEVDTPNGTGLLLPNGLPA